MITCTLLLIIAAHDLLPIVAANDLLHPAAIHSVCPCVTLDGAATRFSCQQPLWVPVVCLDVALDEAGPILTIVSHLKRTIST